LLDPRRLQKHGRPTHSQHNPGLPDTMLSFSKIPGDAFLTSLDAVDSLVGLAHVTYVVGCIHLDLESIRIVELEGFLRSKVREFKTSLPQPCAHCIGVEVGNSEVVMVNGRGFTLTLLNAEERASDTQDVYGRRLLFERHPEEFLVELGSAMKVGNAHRDVVQADRPEAGGRRSCEYRGQSACAGRQSCKRDSHLSAIQLTTLQITQHSFYGVDYMIPSVFPKNVVALVAGAEWPPRVELASRQEVTADCLRHIDCLIANLYWLSNDDFLGIG